MKKFFIPVLLLFLLCSTSVFALSSEFSGYDAKEFKYSNTAIGFSIKFNANWNIYYSFDVMSDETRQLVQAIDEEMFLFFGLTKNQMIGSRGLVEEVDMELDDYFSVIKDVNAGAIANIKEKKVKINKNPMIYWTYETPENGISYAEYIFKKDGFNVRLTFWTLKSLFKKYTKEFEAIMKTFQAE